MKMRTSFIGICTGTAAFVAGTLAVLFYIAVPSDSVGDPLKSYEEDTSFVCFSTAADPIIKDEEFQVINTEQFWKTDEQFSSKIKLIHTGKHFQPDDIKAGNGEIWLGLFQENGGFDLRKTKLNIETVRVDMTNEYESGSDLRKNVSVGGENDPIFLIKGGNFSSGKIDGVLSGPMWPEALESEKAGRGNAATLMLTFNNDFSKKFEMNGLQYELKVIKAKAAFGGDILALVFGSSEKAQVLHVTGYDNGTLGNLYWVGDLDRDNKPDLFLSLWENDALHNAVLLLSSQADGDNLVKQAANFLTGSGC